MKRGYTKGRLNGGFAMITCLCAMGILFSVAALLLSNVSSLVTNTQLLQQKNQIYDASEAGLDSAVDLLDRVNTAGPSTSCPGGTLQGYTFTCGVADNNFTQGSNSAVTDPVNSSNTVNVPPGEALVWAKSASVLGGRTVWVEAVVSDPIQSFNFPQGAINAQNNVTGGGHMPVYADPTDTANPDDANVHANNNVTAFTSVVQGLTYAVGTDSQAGYDGTTNSGATPVAFPSTSFVTSFTNYSYQQARSGTVVSPSTLNGNKTYTYTGNTYFGNSSGTTGSGNLDLSQGTYVFNGGIVFVDGFLCISGQAHIVNNGATFVVRTQFAQAGNSSSYNATSGQDGILAVLGPNTAPSCTAANGSYSANISGNGSENIGLLYTPNGSVDLAGNGQLQGSIDAGVDAVLSGGGSGGTFTYDRTLVTALITAPQNAKILSYAEYSK